MDTPFGRVSSPRRYVFSSPRPLYLVFPLCQAHLLSAEFGKHLLEVEDLLQKHKLMEADIAIQGDKVKAITAATLQFTEETGEAAAVLQPLARRSSAPAWISLLALEFRFFPPLMVPERSLKDRRILQRAGSCLGDLYSEGVYKHHLPFIYSASSRYNRDNLGF